MKKSPTVSGSFPATVRIADRVGGVLVGITVAERSTIAHESGLVKLFVVGFFRNLADRMALLLREVREHDFPRLSRFRWHLIARKR